MHSQNFKLTSSGGISVLIALALVLALSSGSAACVGSAGVLVGLALALSGSSLTSVGSVSILFALALGSCDMSQSNCQCKT